MKDILRTSFKTHKNTLLGIFVSDKIFFPTKKCNYLILKMYLRLPQMLLIAHVSSETFIQSVLYMCTGDFQVPAVCL